MTLIKKVYNIEDLQANNNITTISEILLKWKKLKKNEELEIIVDKFIDLTFYVNKMQMDRNILQHIISEVKEDKNHYALREREAVKELKKLRNDKTIRWEDLQKK